MHDVISFRWSMNLRRQTDKTEDATDFWYSDVIIKPSTTYQKHDNIVSQNLCCHLVWLFLQPNQNTMQHFSNLLLVLLIVYLGLK